MTVNMTSPFIVLDDVDGWREPLANESCSVVVRSQRWPHLATKIVVESHLRHRMWISRDERSLLEEMATTLERNGSIDVVHETPRSRVTLPSLRGRWCGWRNASLKSRRRSSGLALDGSVLAETLEVLGDSMPRYAQWLAQQILVGQPRKILEVGAGTGTMTRLLGRASQVVAFEPSPDTFQSLERACREIPGTSAVASLTEAAKLGPFDAIVLVNVLEHIDDDVGALAELQGLLAPDGYVAVISPAHNMLYSTFDASIGHVRRYSRKRARLTMEKAGYSKVRVRYFNAVGAVLWLIVNRWLRKTSASTGQTAIYDKIVVPISSLVDRLGFRPFGQSIIMIGTSSRNRPR
jgi:SAM-dependent methyltransferase